MRTFLAFVAADLTAAAISVAWLALEGVLQGASIMRLDVFIFGFIVGAISCAPAIAIGGLIWIAFRSHCLNRVLPFILIGSLLGVIYYLLLVALGVGAPSDRPMTLFDNIRRPFQLLRLGGAATTGAIAALVFRSITFKERRRTRARVNHTALSNH